MMECQNKKAVSSGDPLMSGLNLALLNILINYLNSAIEALLIKLSIPN